MKASQFSYARPDTLEEALALMADEGTEPMALAGGQSLMPMMNFRVARPGVLVDLNRVPGLSGIEEGDATVRIGAMTRYRDLAASEVVAARLPLVAAALARPCTWCPVMVRETCQPMSSSLAPMRPL